MVHKIQYRKRFVAFLDVMGFKELLREDHQGKERLQQFYGHALRSLKFLKGKSIDGPLVRCNFQSIFVSDAIVLSVDVPENIQEAKAAAREFFSIISYFQATLAFQSKIWIRGAITVGDLHIDEKENILVGPAFVKAYNLESMADFPRVIIDPLVCAHFDLLPHQFVDQLNMGDNILMGPSNGMRWGGAIHMNDAVQIDWFYTVACINDLDFHPFFQDLKKRMTFDQAIFLKSFKLLAFFRESLSAIPDRLRNERTKLLGEKLKEFGV